MDAPGQKEKIGGSRLRGRESRYKHKEKKKKYQIRKGGRTKNEKKKVMKNSRGRSRINCQREENQNGDTGGYNRKPGTEDKQSTIFIRSHRRGDNLKGGAAWVKNDERGERGENLKGRTNHGYLIPLRREMELREAESELAVGVAGNLGAYGKFHIWGSRSVGAPGRGAFLKRGERRRESKRK